MTVATGAEEHYEGHLALKRVESVIFADTAARRAEITEREVWCGRSLGDTLEDLRDGSLQISNLSGSYTPLNRGRGERLASLLLPLCSPLT